MGILDLANRNKEYGYTAWVAFGSSAVSASSVIEERQDHAEGLQEKHPKVSVFWARTCQQCMPHASAGYVACEPSLDFSDYCQPDCHEMLYAGRPATAAFLLQLRVCSNMLYSDQVRGITYNLTVSALSYHKSDPPSENQYCILYPNQCFHTIPSHKPI
jgi:hypothetical protein